MLRFLGQILATVIAIPIFLILAMIFFIAIGEANKPTLAKSVVISADLRAALPDKAEVNPFAQTTGADARSAIGLVRTLRDAETDDRVKGLYLRVGGGLPLAQVQELREAIAAFKASGKFIIAHTQNITTSGLGAYYLGVSADELWMQGDGVILASGVSTSTLFMKDLLDEIGVEADLRGYKDFKSAGNAFLYQDYPEAMREARTTLINSLYDTTMADIAEDRGLSVADLKARLDTAPTLARDALESNLVDRLGYEVEARESAKERGGEGTRIVSAKKYVELTGNETKSGGSVVALIHGDGPIMEGGSGNDSPFGGSNTMGGDAVAGAIEAAIKDEDVKAIVFRVNSPGGSATASEQIRHALSRAQEAGKPVIISMGNVAASGGYWVSMTADHILAHPGTVTGSIGVIMGKFVVGGLFERLMLNQGELSVGESATLFSGQRKFTDAEWDRLDAMLRQIYDDFVTRAAEGRGMSVAELEEHAKGRVWTGAQALERNLIDGYGGLRTAIAEARRRAEIPEDDRVVLRDFPKQPGLLELFDELLSASADGVKAAHAFNRIMVRLGLPALLDATTQTSPTGIEAKSSAPVAY